MTKDATSALRHPDQFIHRHIGPSPAETAEMLAAIGHESLDSMIESLVPASIRLGRDLELPEALSEFDALRQLRTVAEKNQVFRSCIGMGYHDCVVPPVIQRNILENPGWYTQYTPYQSEISQGRLESLLNFQTMVCDLTGLAIANASLLDEATACAEAMTLCHRMKGSADRNRFLVAETCHPQNIAVLQTRALPLGIEVIVSASEKFELDANVFGVLVQYPDTNGTVSDHSELVEKAHNAGALVAVATDLLALTLLKPPGDFGADIAVGNSQRFGVPLGYGGPHAAFFATRDEFKRSLPGRLIGVSKDSRGRPAFRLTLATREQHIRRDKATSNICTAQALLANMAAMYAVYHGPEGLTAIANRVHCLAKILAKGIERLGHWITLGEYFDTVRIGVKQESSAKNIVALAEAAEINLRVFNVNSVGIALDETTDTALIDRLFQIFNNDEKPDFTAAEIARDIDTDFPDALRRESKFLTHPVFQRHRSETKMLRYLKRLESRDLSLTASMIPLGSCTMKLNATSQMQPVSWPEFAGIHPFAPIKQSRGYLDLFADLEDWLATITGFEAVSLQPNSGAQGEFAGLLVIQAFHASRKQSHRNVCLIPTSAHGTNPASAAMAGLTVVPVKCDAAGNIDMEDLRAKAANHAEKLAALMVTYPSTHGVFEESIREVCEIIHTHGGQVYMDGANLNAQVGLCAPGDMGADVCHINLHKTFCIPHGGGGPGMGPIGVAEHLLDFLPDHPVVNLGGEEPIGPVSAAPWGSAGILPISWMYIATMGATGLTDATRYAILNANYISRQLADYFPTLYKGRTGLVAHECILDLRTFKKTTAEDVAKRLIDFGFHAPTLSWPVAGTLMVEPTESESKDELDRFIEAMIAIHGEMTDVENGDLDAQNNPLKNAPHTGDMIADSGWDHPYPREQAAYPVDGLLDYKYWPPVGRVDNVAGDRNPICTCPSVEDMAD
ncbi:MAG: aminomethyl-transferring glycine dehydrogenase [Verrucomicrobiae bacterium]|nr:aminomethyl-transferring glycine dehydrogenase [Verrucomicrobiae bacterium]